MSTPPFPTTPRDPLPPSPPCPFCGSSNTALLSPFGGQLSVAQYWCRECRTGFERLKG
jgi:hypothetical protein